MHPIVSEQIARSRLEELRREAAIARRTSPARPGRPASGVHRVRLGLATAALALARSLDRDGRVVPAVVRTPR